MFFGFIAASYGEDYKKSVEITQDMNSRIVDHDDAVVAAKKACCHDFIMSLPDGYSTVIGEGGARLKNQYKHIGITLLTFIQ